MSATAVLNEPLILLKSEILRWSIYSLRGTYSLVANIFFRMNKTSSDVLPSQVTNQRYLFWPPGSDDLQMEEGGKWLIFLEGEFEKLDGYWNSFRPLCGENGTLYKIRTTTAVNKEGGLINCYTRNAEDRSDVRRAAVAIDEAIHIRESIYYKTNRATEEGQYNVLGKTKVSKYQFRPGRKFFERDAVTSFWIPVQQWPAVRS